VKVTTGLRLALLPPIVWVPNSSTINGVELEKRKMTKIKFKVANK
jgi:hypothetical protein